MQSDQDLPFNLRFAGLVTTDVLVEEIQGFREGNKNFLKSLAYKTIILL